MPQISVHEFERLPLRVHDFLAGVPLHDVWAIDLPGTRAGITLDEFLRTASARSRVSCDCCKNDGGGKGCSFDPRRSGAPPLTSVFSPVGSLVGIGSPPQPPGNPSQRI